MVKVEKDKKIQLNFKTFYSEKENLPKEKIKIELSYTLNKNNQPISDLVEGTPEKVIYLDDTATITIEKAETENIYIAITPSFDGKLTILAERIYVDPNSITQNPEKREEMAKIITITFISFLAFMVVAVGLCVFLFKKQKRTSGEIHPSRSEIESQGSENLQIEIDATMQHILEESIIRQAGIEPRTPPRPETPDFPSLNMRIFNHKFPLILAKNLSSKQWENLDKCAICYSVLFLKEGEELPEGEDLRDVRLIEECKHMFHEDCLIKWFLKEEKCPCCRRYLDCFALLNYEFQKTLKSAILRSNCIESSFIKDEEGVVKKDIENSTMIKEGCFSSYHAEVGKRKNSKFEKKISEGDSSTALIPIEKEFEIKPAEILESESYHDEEEGEIIINFFDMRPTPINVLTKKKTNGEDEEESPTFFKSFVKSKIVLSDSEEDLERNEKNKEVYDVMMESVIEDFDKSINKKASKRFESKTEL